MPGIGMGDKYSWTQPPTFNKRPGDYDYMEGATSYNPKSLSTIENQMNDVLDSISSEVTNCSVNIFNTTALTSLGFYWNSLFLINGEEQRVVDSDRIVEIGLETERGFVELKETVASYFDDAKVILDNISKSLEQLESNAKLIANAEIAKKSGDETISGPAKVFLDNVRKNGKQYTKSDLSSIGKWVY